MDPMKFFPYLDFAPGTLALVGLEAAMLVWGLWSDRQEWIKKDH